MRGVLISSVVLAGHASVLVYWFVASYLIYLVLTHINIIAIVFLFILA